MKGDVIVFSDNSNLEDKTDVIESMLLSELAADKKMYPTASEWFAFYKSIMGNIGWVSPASTGFTESTHESDDAKSHLHEVGKVVVDKIAKTAVGNKFSSKLTNFFNGLLNAGIESQELALFTEEHGKDEVRKNFFLAGVVDHDGNNPTLTLVAIELNVDLSSAQTLFCQAKSFNYKVASYAAQLNKVVFNWSKKLLRPNLETTFKPMFVLYLEAAPRIQQHHQPVLSYPPTLLLVYFIYSSRLALSLFSKYFIKSCSESRMSELIVKYILINLIT